MLSLESFLSLIEIVRLSRVRILRPTAETSLVGAPSDHLRTITTVPRIYKTYHFQSARARVVEMFIVQNYEIAKKVYGS